MKLGDFFANSPKARPVNPKRIAFTAVSKDKTVLPGGARNTSGRQVAAEVVGCLEFIGAEGAAEARRDAKKYLSELGTPYDESDLALETQNQILWRALREFDDVTKCAGDALFQNVGLVRTLLEHSECSRIGRAYDAYVKEEHPEVIDTATF